MISASEMMDELPNETFIPFINDTTRLVSSLCRGVRFEKKRGPPCGLLHLDGASGSVSQITYQSFFCAVRLLLEVNILTFQENGLYFLFQSLLLS